MTALALLALAQDQARPVVWATGVTSAAFRPDGAVIATGGWDNVVRIWRTADGTLLRSLRGHKEHVTSIEFSADGRFLVSGGSDGTVRLWSATSDRMIRTVRAGTSYVSGVGVSPDGQRLFSSGYDNRAKVWAGSGKLTRTLVGLPSDAYSMALSGDGKRLAAGGPSDGLCVWDTLSGKLVWSKRLPGDVAGLRFHPKEPRLAVAALSGDYWVFDSTSGAPETEFTGNVGRADGVTWLGDRLLLASNGGLNLAAPGASPTLWPLGGDAEAVAVSPDGTLAVAGGFDGWAAVVTTRDGSVVRWLRR
jgi:WD40 repeat protein